MNFFLLFSFKNLYGFHYEYLLSASNTTNINHHFLSKSFITSLALYMLTEQMAYPNHIPGHINVNIQNHDTGDQHIQINNTPQQPVNSITPRGVNAMNGDHQWTQPRPRSPVLNPYVVIPGSKSK